MTNNQNIADDAAFADLLTEVADLPVKEANAFEAGVLAVLGIVHEAAGTYSGRVIKEAEAQGYTAKFAAEQIDGVFGPLNDLAQPRLDALRDATRKAQGYTNGIAEQMQGVEDMLASLLTDLIGEDAANAFRAEVQEFKFPQDSDEPLADWERELLAGDEDCTCEEDVAQYDADTRTVLERIFGKPVNA